MNGKIPHQLVIGIEGLPYNLVERNGFNLNTSKSIATKARERNNSPYPQIQLTLSTDITNFMNTTC